MSDFLLELLSEEIPARMQDKARADLARLFEEQLAEAGLKAEAIETYATPRRLALIARGLPERDRRGQRGDQGPAHGRAAAGARRLSAQDRPHPGPARRARRHLVRDRRAGRAAPPPKSSPRRSRRSSAPFPGPSRCAGARPRSRPRARAGCGRCRASSPCSATRSSISRSPGSNRAPPRSAIASTIPASITIGGAQDYVEKLRACHVIVDHEERKAHHPQGVREAAAQDEHWSPTKR